MDGWIVGRLEALADRWTDGLVGNRRTDRRMDAQIDGWAKGGTERWTDEQTDDHSNLKHVCSAGQTSAPCQIDRLGNWRIDQWRSRKFV